MTQPTTQQLRQLRKDIGARIRARRTQRRLTLRRLSRITGLCPHRLDQYELGRHQITLEALAQIATALQTEPRQLLPGEQALLKPTNA